MLKIKYKNKEYQFQIEEVSKPLSYVYGTIELDNNWRDLDYKNGGHTLKLGAATCFEIPRELFKELSECDFFYNDQIFDEVEDGIICKELPVFNFDLTISYSDIFNFKQLFEIITKRAEYMEDETKNTEGLMAAVIGINKEEVKQKVLAMDIGSTLVFSNPMPYGPRLEYDAWSTQAPDGIVRPAVKRMVKILNKDLGKK